MPLLIQSRYRGLPVYQVEQPDGSTRATVAIRPSTPPVRTAQPFRHTVAGLEGIEYLAWRYYGSSDAWWRIAEANPLAFPLDLAPGASVAIPALEDLGRIERTRSF